MIVTTDKFDGAFGMSEENIGTTATVRLDAELIRKARAVCVHRRGRGGRPLKLVDYLDHICRAKIEADYRSAISEAATEETKKGKKE